MKTPQIAPLSRSARVRQSPDEIWPLRVTPTQPPKRAAVPMREWLAQERPAPLWRKAFHFARRISARLDAASDAGQEAASAISPSAIGAGTGAEITP